MDVSLNLSDRSTKGNGHSVDANGLFFQLLLRRFLYSWCQNHSFLLTFLEWAVRFWEDPFQGCLPCIIAIFLPRCLSQPSSAHWSLYIGPLQRPLTDSGVEKSVNDSWVLKEEDTIKCWPLSSFPSDDFSSEKHRKDGGGCAMRDEIKTDSQ